MSSFVVAYQQKDTYTSHEVTGLRPYCEYEFVVQTHATGLRQLSHQEMAGAEELPMTQPVCCRTLEDVPSMPQSVTITNTTTDSITISWKPPRNINGLLRGYRLYFDREASPEFNLAELPASTSSYTARHLFSATTYRFQRQFTSFPRLHACLQTHTHREREWERGDIHTHTHTHSLTHSHTHPHTHSLTHSLTLTHTHTHSLSLSLSPFAVLAFTAAGEGPIPPILTQRTRDSALNRFKLQSL